jgi:uncharacterized protein (TIGR02996 family)
MSEEDALVRAILAAPDDAAPRLVYADWLEERGDPRGEYLRCQCERAGLPPAHPRNAALRARQEELRRQHPAVILPWLARLALGRVQALLERMGRDRGEGAKEWPEVYTPGPRLTERALARWEAHNGVSLPEEYRFFLRQVGNGGRMPGDYCDFEVRALAPGSAGPLLRPTLREAFSVPTEQVRERVNRRRASGRPATRGLFPELDEYDSERPPPGCLWVGSYPSSDPVFLVVSGEQRGTVWGLAGWWVPEHDPLGDQFDFLSWFESVLLEARGW